MSILRLSILVLISSTLSCTLLITSHSVSDSENISSVERPISEDSSISEILTAAPNTLLLILDSPAEESEYIPDTIRMHYSVNGQHPKHIFRYSRVDDQLEFDYRKGQRIFMKHFLYLEMAENLQSGRDYTIESPYGSDTLNFDAEETICPAIKVSQGGYSIFSDRRYAVLGIFLGDGGTVQLDAPDFQVLEEGSKTVVHSGSAEAAGFDEESGEYTYRLDLSSVTRAGSYFISIEDLGRSYSFDIDELEDEIYKVVRGMYHQRCGTALKQPYTEYIRGNCHTEVAYIQESFSDPEDDDLWIKVPEGTEMHEIHGGYHDAGDYDRRPMHTLVPVFMLSYFDLFPERFSDSQFNLPERGNGIPDFLDEALWGVKLYEYLQLDENNSSDSRLYGGVMTGTEGSRHPTGYGVTHAANDDIVYGTYEVTGHATASACGMFAQAARLLQPFDYSRSQELMIRAEKAWTFLMENPSYCTELESQLMYASLQMYLATATGNPAEDSVNVYHQRFRTIAGAVFIDNSYGWPREYKPGYLFFSFNNANMVFSPYFAAYLTTSYATDNSIVAAIRQNVINNANSVEALVSGQVYPVGQQRANWASGTGQGWTADVLCLAYKLSGDSRFFDAVAQLACYDQGLNALGKSYITGVGEDQVNAPLHLDSWFPKYGQGLFSAPIGNVPGIIIYGASAGRSGQSYQMVISEKLYPPFDTLPVHRRWSDGWSLVNCNEFTVWETLVINACMFGFLGGR